MKHEEIPEKIKVMLHFENGGEIEVIDRTDKTAIWQKTSRPVWNWAHENYRIKPEQKETPQTHKIIIDFKFKIGDTVKIIHDYYDNTIYEVCGYEHYSHANGNTVGTMYQLLKPNGEYGRWTSEDALELYHECIPLTEEERYFIKERTQFFMKGKWNLYISHGIISELDSVSKEDFYFLNPTTQCWEEWSEELEKELLK